MNSTIFNNAPSDSRCTVPLPPYDPMNDPHLLEYFERRFGNIQRISKVCRVHPWFLVEFVLLDL
jgi:hypothetical protein